MSEEKDALLILPDMDICGGGEKVSYEAGKILAEKGYNIDILTNSVESDETEILPKLEEAYGTSENFRDALREIRIIDHGLVKKFVRYRYKESYQWLKASKMHGENFYDLIVTHYSNIHFMPEFDGTQVIYFLGPGPKHTSMKIRAALSIYMVPYNLLNMRTRKRRQPRNYTFVCVSEYTKDNFSEKFPDFKFEKIYPPIDTDEFRYSGEEKEKKIVNFSRISPDKRNHKFIEAVSRIPEERREGWKFRVIGKLRESERSYFEKLKSMRQDLGLENCLEIRTDLDFDELKTELKTSRLYIHTAINETMGITPVEALAAGNDILVHKSGGPWVDIADQGEYGEGWSDEEELVKKMKDFMKNGEPEVERNVKRARKFDRDRFRESFSELISEVER